MHYCAHCQYGYYGKDVIVRVDKRLKFAPYSQAGVRIYDDKDLKRIDLISYETIVISVINNVLTCLGTYSRTTAKHITYFLREYFPNLSYDDVKKSYINGYSLNVITGEKIYKV